MKIKNFNKLAKSDLRKNALNIVEAGLLAIDTKQAVQKGIQLKLDSLFINNKEFPLKKVENIFVVGVGKCSAASAEALETILGEKISGGVVIDVCNSPNLKYIDFYQGTHPFPSDINKKATNDIINLLNKADKNDLVIFVISGGGSTLLHYSNDISPSEEKRVMKRLFEVGANIEEINTIRKHISLGRGGYLAKHAYPARSVSLIFSDVPSNDIQFIASGPTVKDKTTVRDAEAVLKKYEILKKCNIENWRPIETPKDDKYFEKVENILFISNKTALSAMNKKAEELGYNSEICNTHLTGEARIVGVEIIKELHNYSAGTVLLYGGETTVTIKKKGKGGRAQELALSSLREMQEDELLLAFASDGWDNTKHAGALCDKITKEKAKEISLNPVECLDQNQSFAFFEKTGDYLETGFTGSNVADLILAIKKKE